MNGKYMGGSNVIMITFGDLDSLPYPDKFSTAISNCERVLECVTMITTVGLDNKINERHLMSMERSCLFSTRNTTYYEAKAMWLGREENREGNREDTNPPGEYSLTAIGSMTEQIARLQADTSNRENIKFFIQYIKKEMKIMRLQMASEEEWECTNDARQGKTHNHRSYAAHHHTDVLTSVFDTAMSFSQR